MNRRLIVIGAIGVIGVIGASLVAGCIRRRQPEPVTPESLLSPLGEGPPNGVELTVYFVSHPTGGAANRFAADTWAGADEGMTAPDVGALWRANGLRVGLVKAAVVQRAEALHRAGPDPDGGHCMLRRLRVPHRGGAVLAASQPLPRATLLITRPGQRTVVRSVAGASVGLRATCRVVDDQTVYVELVPQVLQPGRDPDDTGLLDFLTTEVAVERPQAILVGVGAPMRHTAGRMLLTSGRGEGTVERLVIIAAEPVCLAR